MSTPRPSALKTILIAGIIAGILDIIAAIVVSNVRNNVEPIRVLQAIASGVFGKEAFKGGNTMAAYGLAFHFLIATIWAIIYFIVYKLFLFVRKGPVLLNGFIYGLFVWVMMNRVILPLSKFRQGVFKWENALINMAILVFMVGIPIAYIVHQRMKRPTT